MAEQDDSKLEEDEMKEIILEEGIIGETKSSNEILEQGMINNPSSVLTVGGSGVSSEGINLEKISGIISSLLEEAPKTDEELESQNHNENTTLEGGDFNPNKISNIKDTFKDILKSIIHTIGTHQGKSEGNVIVKFNLLDESSFVYEFNLYKNVYEMKEELASIFKVPLSWIRITTDGKEPDDWLPLPGLGYRTEGVIEVDLDISEDYVHEASPKQSLKTMIVNLRDSINGVKNVEVTVQNVCTSKEWLGGFFDLRTCQVYHNASAQTMPPRKESSKKNSTPLLKYSREAQTVLPTKNESVDTPLEKATQMWRADHYIPSLGDKIITAQKYISFKEFTHGYEIEKVVKAQRIVRAWLAWKQAKGAKPYRTRGEVDCLTEQRELAKSTSYPETRGDFYQLYSLVYSWWSNELKKIDREKFGAARKAALVALLEKELVALFNIETQRIKSKNERFNRKDLAVIDTASQPQLKSYPNGAQNLIDTMEIQRARELKEIYSCYMKTNLGSSNERIDFILSLKNFLENYDSIDLTRDIIKLLEREVDLLSIGIKDKFLIELRKNIQMLLLELMKKPEFNPQVRILNKIDPSIKGEELQRCHSCRRVLRVRDFLIHVRMRQFWVCQSCEWMRMVSQKCLNLMPYKRILSKVRASEMTKESYSPVCFLLQEYGMYFLVNVLWNGHSAVSQFTNIADLRFPRWEKEKPWTPWNCILLTVDEETVHEKVDVEIFYGENFIQRVKERHLHAKLHFKDLLREEARLKYTGKWNKDEIGTIMETLS